MVEPSVACILSFFKRIRIQLEVLYDIIKGVFLIGTKFQGDVMRCCSVVAESKLRNVAVKIWDLQRTNNPAGIQHNYNVIIKPN